MLLALVHLHSQEVVPEFQEMELIIENLTDVQKVLEEDRLWLPTRSKRMLEQRRDASDVAVYLQIQIDDVIASMSSLNNRVNGLMDQLNLSDRRRQYAINEGIIVGVVVGVLLGVIIMYLKGDKR